MGMMSVWQKQSTTRDSLIENPESLPPLLRKNASIRLEEAQNKTQNQGGTRLGLQRARA